MGVLRQSSQEALQRGLVAVALGQVTPTASNTVVAGKRRLGQTAPVQSVDRFAIGSNTKAMTCAALVAQAARGGPALDLTVAQCFADWADTMHPAYAQVTLQDLLHHRGALPAFNGSGPEENDFLAAVAADTQALPTTLPGRRAYFARWLLAQPPVNGVTPTQDFHYSNAGYALAAAMVEAQTGQSFEAVFDTVLVQPLGLQGQWRSPVPRADDALQGHEGPADALVQVVADAESLAAQDWLDTLAPAGHWACTADAYAHWLRWHVLALQGSSTPLPTRYVGDLRAAAGNRYLWGWQSQATAARVLLLHTGHEPGFMTEAALDRTGAFAVFGISNTGHEASDGTSWVLSTLDAMLADVLRREGIVL